MIRPIRFAAFITLLIVLYQVSSLQAATDPADIQRLLDSLRTVEAPIFSPKAFQKAADQFEQAKQSIQYKRSPSTIEEHYVKAREFAENALKNADVCKLSLREYLPPRDKARAAKAHVLVPALYEKAETQFTAAAAKVESGDVKGGLKEADKSSPLFDVAEIEAIRVDILGKADALIATAVADEAVKYALTTLDQARTAREKGNEIINADRYNRDAATKEAKRAEYEAKHASNISQSVRSLNRNDQAWEKLMLLYEIQMNRAAASLKMQPLPFDLGPSQAADSLIASIGVMTMAMSSDARSCADSISRLREAAGAAEQQKADLLSDLNALGKLLGETSDFTDPFVAVEAVGGRVSAMQQERDRLAAQVTAEQSKISELSEQHQEVSSELEVRQQREQRLAEAKALIDPTEGELLVNAANDIVLRLFALSFDAGKSEVTDVHRPLLEKVKQIIGLFPESKFVVEGHTDDRGDPAINTQLSDKRAFAVMQYLRQAMDLPSDRIRAMGYGSEKPIASQATAEGRAKNRRIDIVIMQ